jgi:hypothetical protein
MGDAMSLSVHRQLITDVPRNRRCGSTPSQADVMAAEAVYSAALIPPDFKIASDGPAILNVFWHVISRDGTLKGGNIP